MKYIRIKNSGLIEPQALHLVGASTKRNDSTKIGQFGSGNKYALAYLLRNDYNVTIFSGQNELKIHTEKETFRDMDFDIIFINDQKTSITTEMGKDWEFWQAIREIYCNAIDEGGCSMDFVQTIQPQDNETHFYIDTKKDVMEFISNYDNYFAYNKKVLFECSQGRILEKTGAKANIYRKGINCFKTDKTSVFDYDFNDISIDENRLIKYFWNVEEKMWDLIYRCDNKEVILQILHNLSNHEYIEGCLSDISTISNNASEIFKSCLKEIRVAPIGYAGLLKPDEVQNHVIIPTKIFKSIRGIIGDENVGDKFKVTKSGAFYREIETSLLGDATIKKAIDFFKEVKFSIPYKIKTAIFDDKSIMGTVQNDCIILSEICLEKGVNEIVNTIIEEFIHIKYKCDDETRDFQTSVITEFISYMKNINAYVI